jgi:signal transduction histidine kinase
MNPDISLPRSTAAHGEPFNFAEALLKCIACGTIVILPTGQIIAFNTVAERFIGLSAAETVGRPMSILPPAIQALVEETLANGQALPARRIELAGERRGEFQIGTQIAQPSGSKILSVLVELQNVGEAESIAANLEHLDRLANLGVLGAGAAHEIKNALVAVRTFVDLLRERHKDDELSQLVSREIMRIDTVVKQMLHGATRAEFTLAPLGIHTLLNDLVNLLRHEFQARSVELAVKLNAGTDRVNGDERQLRHALLNLLMNAVEALNDTGHVSISTENVTSEGRSCLSVTIADTGSGIRPEHLPRLFTPFFTTKKEGTGLGLAITRSIIEEHQGTVRAQSGADEGTRFEVVLPLL